MNLNKKTQVLMISHFGFKDFKDQEKGEFFPQGIRNALREKIGKLTYIDHPFPSSTFPASQMRVYENNKKVYQLITPKLEMPIMILFVYQIFVTFFFFIRKLNKYDLCIACNNLSLICAFPFRKIGLIKKIVYYTVDYTPVRYKNPFLNSLYHRLDRIASVISDKNWVTVENMITAKVKNGLNLKRSAPFQIVPIGFNIKDIVIRPVKEINRFNLIFVGIMLEKQGLQLIIQALPKLIKKYPKINLTVIGAGPFESQIETLVNNLHLTAKVKFTGYIDDQKKIIKFLTKNGGIGIATYVPSIGDYTYNADPSKIKLYLLCGLPVITTGVPPIAKEIIKNKAGFMVDYSEGALIKSLDYLLKSDQAYSIFRENALHMSKVFDINSILEKAFKEIS